MLKNKDAISNKWHLATRNQQKFYKLAWKNYFFKENLGVEKSIDDFLHTENFVLIDKNRYIRCIYNG